MNKQILLIVLVMLLTGAIHAQPSTYVKPELLSDGIATGTLKDAKLDEHIILAMNDSIVNGNYPNVHSVLVFRKNRLVYEKYYPGEDEVWGRKTGVIPHHRDSLHDLRSVTKSFVGAAIMIAVDRGKIKDIDQRVIDFFPEFAQLDTGFKKEITIRHLLTMSSGLDWNEYMPYTDPKNSETQMNRSSNPVLYVLSQPATTKPGLNFNYSGGNTQVLAAIVEKATGMPVDKYVATQLFEPLGITEFHWIKRRDDIPVAASGLRLRSRDFLKFGIMILNEGKWNGRQVISSSAIKEMSRIQISPGFEAPGVKIEYGCHIWTPTFTIPGGSLTMVQCEGNGGQYIFIDKKNETVVVATAGNYNSFRLRKSSMNVYMDFVVPAIGK